MATNEQAGWKKRKTPNLAISHEASTASSTPVASSRSSRNKQAGSRGPGAQGQRQITHLEDVITMMAWEILMMKQKMGALRCGANFVVILRDNTWKQKVAEVCEGWFTKQQEKTMDRHTRGLAQNEEQLLGVSSHYSTKQPLRDTLSARVSQKYTLDGQRWDSRKWPNANRQFGTVYLGPSNQFIPNTRRTSHGLGWPLFVLMHQLLLWINFGP